VLNAVGHSVRHLFLGAGLVSVASGCGRITEIDVLLLRDAGRGSPEESGAAGGSEDAGMQPIDACASGCEAQAACVDSSTYPGGGIFKSDFSDVADMTLNRGAATIAGGAIRLVSVTGIEEGSAYFTSPVPFDPQTSVYAKFAVRIGGGAGAMGTDGMAFVIQSSPDGPRAIGIAGGGLGYKLVTPSVAIELDTFFNPASDPDGNHVALIANGDELTHIASAMPTFDLNDGMTRNMWLDYDASKKLVEVYMSDSDTKPASALLSYPGFDFSASLGNQVYIGFSAASGSSKNDHDLLGQAWFVTSPLPKCR
jgi:hypothetical protein